MNDDHQLSDTKPHRGSMVSTYDMNSQHINLSCRSVPHSIDEKIREK